MTWGNSVNDLMLSQFTVEIKDSTWQYMGYVNGEVSLKIEPTYVGVKQGIPRFTIAEFLVDLSAMFSFNLRSYNLSTLNGLLNGLATVTGKTSVDTGYEELLAGTYSVQHIGYTAAATTMARTRWPIRFAGLTAANKIFVGVLYKCAFKFPGFNFPDNEKTDDVNSIPVEMEVFPDSTKTAQKELGYMAIQTS